jgi:hypothetical protein
MKDPAQILQESATTHDKKNEDYGESWRAIGHVLHGLANGEPIVLETPEDFISFGLFTRRLDKIARCFNGEFLSDELNYESISDSHADETAYAAMHASLLAEQEPVEYTRDKDDFPVTNVSIGYQAATEKGPSIEPEYQDKYEELVGDTDE